jgi:hypothetical protein
VYNNQSFYKKHEFVKKFEKYVFLNKIDSGVKNAINDVVGVFNSILNFNYDLNLQPYDESIINIYINFNLISIFTKFKHPNGIYNNAFNAYLELVPAVANFPEPYDFENHVFNMIFIYINDNPKNGRLLYTEFETLADFSKNLNKPDDEDINNAPQ